MTSLKLFVSFLTTTVFFVVEAMIHYNIGKTGHISLRQIPSLREFVKIVGVVMMVSFLSVLVSGFINTYLGTNDETDSARM